MVNTKMNSKQVDRLFLLNTKNDVEKFIKDIYPNSNWRNLGDRESPAANVEVSPDPINPLCERLVNAMEGMIELKVQSELRKGSNIKLPSSAFEAVERYYNIPKGRARNLTDKDRRELGQNIKLILRGSTKDPTIVVQDHGIGIHPDEMPDTILSLANSKKGKKPYLIGAYGHGGSSSFEWCEYTIIICWKEPSLLGSKEDMVGWTIVRKSALPGARVNDYQYLVDVDDTVPRFTPQHLGENVMKHGVFISHVGVHHTGSFSTQPPGLSPYQTLDFRLFDPVLPYILVEERPEFIGGNSKVGLKGYVGGWDRALAGARGRLEGLYANPEARRKIEFWNNGYMVQLEEGRSIRINYWVIEDLEVDNISKVRKNDHKGKAQYLKDGGRLSQRPCAVTFGGQVHTSLTDKVFREKGLKRVGESTIVHVETDEMGDAFRGFFGSNRGEPKEQSEKQIEQWLSDAIDIHLNELKAIQHRRFEAFLSRTKTNPDIEVRKVLDPMIQEFLRREMGYKLESVARRKLPGFKPKKIPTYLTFADENKTLQLAPGDSVNIVLLTNAQDDVMQKAKFELMQSKPNVLTANLISHFSGRWIVRVSAYPNAVANSVCEISASLRLSNVWVCSTSKARKVKIVPHFIPPPYIYTDPPTKFRIKTQGGEVRLQEGKRRVIWIDTNCADDILARLTDIAEFDIVSLPKPLKYRGLNQPIRGQIGLVVSTPTGIAPMKPGNLEVQLKLVNGSVLSDQAPVVILPQSPRGGVIKIKEYTDLPNYEVVYVTEQPNGDKSWQDMQDQFGEEWNGEDVAGYTIEPDAQGNDKLWIFINRDFNDLVTEQRTWASHSESWMKKMISQYEAQVAFQCYQASIGGGEQPQMRKEYDFIPSDYKDHRAEMIRVGKTILWARKRFGHDLVGDIE